MEQVETARKEREEITKVSGAPNTHGVLPLCGFAQRYTGGEFYQGG